MAKVEKNRKTATYNNKLRTGVYPAKRPWYAPLAISRC
nr:MAG TPA: hypothetical protein [Microviridae sp.]